MDLTLSVKNSCKKKFKTVYKMLIKGEVKGGRKRTERSKLEFQVNRTTFTLENQYTMSQTLFYSSVLATAKQEKSYRYTTLQMKPRHRVS